MRRLPPPFRNALGILTPHAHDDDADGAKDSDADGGEPLLTPHAATRVRFCESV